MKNHSIEGAKNNAGYTLLEMFIVVSLLLLLSSTGINHLNSYREHMLLRLSAQAFSGELNRARAASIACGVPVEIRLSRDRKTYNLRLKYTGTDFAKFTLPGSLEFTREPLRPIVFYNSGTCAPSGSYVIASDKLSVKVVVSIMGRVRWEFL